MVKTILGEDHRLIRKVLRALLDGVPDIEVVGKAASGQKLVRLFETIRVDVVLMDIKMPVMEAFDATRLVVENLQSVKILALSLFKNENYINRMLKLGA